MCSIACRGGAAAILLGKIAASAPHSTAHLFPFPAQQSRIAPRHQIRASTSLPKSLPLLTVEGRLILAILKAHRDSGFEVEKSLNELGVVVRPIHVIEVMSSQLDASVGLLFFRWAGRQSNFQHTTATYTALVDFLGRTGQFEAVRVVIDEMKQMGLRITEKTVIALMKNYSRAGMADEALRTFRRMKGEGCWLSSNAYNAILNVLVEADHLHTAQSVVKEMSDSGVTPDRVTIGIYMKALCKGNKIEEALDLLHKGKDFVWQGGNIAHNTVLNALVQRGMTDHAHKVLTDMPGRRCIPDALNYNTVLNGFIKDGRTFDAVNLYHEMIRRRCSPTVATYNIMLVAFFKEGNVDMAIGLFDEMVSKGFFPSNVTYNAIISGVRTCNRVLEVICRFEKTLESEGMRKESRTPYATVLKYLYRVLDLKKPDPA